MNLTGVPAYGVQLAQLLAEVMKLSGHLKAPPKDLQELIGAAKGVIGGGAASDPSAGPSAAVQPAQPGEAALNYVHAVPDHCDRVTWRGDYITLRSERAALAGIAPTPVFVVEMDGGTILKTSGTQDAHVIFIDTDTESGDANQVMHVLGQDQYVIHHNAQTGAEASDLVDQVLTVMTEAQAAAEASQPLPRYVVGLNWKDFLTNMKDEQCMRFVFDTQTKQINALHLETDAGYMLATSAVSAEVLEVLLESDDAFANPYSYGLEYVDEIPDWARPAASLTLPDPVIISLPNYNGPSLYSATHLQDHAIAYLQADRLAAGRQHQHAPSVDDLPLLPTPDYLGMPTRGVNDYFSERQLFEYRELAAEMDRHAYANAQFDTVDEEEEREAPRA